MFDNIFAFDLIHDNKELTIMMEDAAYETSFFYSNYAGFVACRGPC